MAELSERDSAIVDELYLVIDEVKLLKIEIKRATKQSKVLDPQCEAIVRSMRSLINSIQKGK